MLEDPEAYAFFKTELKKLPSNVVVIASHARIDCMKEKVRNNHKNIYCDILNHLRFIFSFSF